MGVVGIASASRSAAHVLIMPTAEVTFASKKSASARIKKTVIHASSMKNARVVIAIGRLMYAPIEAISRSKVAARITPIARAVIATMQSINVPTNQPLRIQKIMARVVRVVESARAIFAIRRRKNAQLHRQ